MAEYKILFSESRKSRGLKPYCVMLVVDPELSRGVSQHDSKEEAEAALAAIKAKAGQS